jgi:transcription antitermination protein NusB|tara:strand:+ start:3162 stop:3638 length:477 start_codon:yes stop_codon:yes gene_type:complete
MNNNLNIASKPKMIKRSLARLVAVQILFQKDFNKNISIDQIKEDVIDNYIIDCQDEVKSYRAKIDNNFLDKIISNILNVADIIDDKISQNLKNGWKISDLDKTILQILRCAIFELNYFDKIPAKVVIDEYVSIAASFFDENKVKFVNATLDKISKNLS